MNKMCNNYFKVTVISVAWLVYLTLLVIPFAEEYNFLSTAERPQSDKLVIYFFMTIPLFVIYLIYIFTKFKSIVFLKSLIYPLLIIGAYLGLFISLLIFGGPILWLLIFTVPLIFILILINFVTGLISDYKYYEKLWKN